MKRQHQPFIPAATTLPEITLRVVVVSIFLTLILATANAYLALKIGILTSASIPAAVISMGILRFFQGTTILENNLVQTAASAGEAVAGGIVYTVPALIMIGYWHAFNYWENVSIALLGGILGVLFSIPLRHLLVSSPTLPFPEGRAIAELLKTSSQKALAMADMVKGGLVGAALELCQSGFKLIATNWDFWLTTRGIVFGFGAGFSATMIGAGYLIGMQVACSILLGALLSWGLLVPLVSSLSVMPASHASAATVATTLWNTQIRYIGIGAMLCAGLYTLMTLAKPFGLGIKTAWQSFTNANEAKSVIARTAHDIPIGYNLSAISLLTLLLAWFCYHYFPLAALGLSSMANAMVIVISVSYIVIMGFIFSGICGYFSGLVGVSASPGSAIIIAGMLLIAVILLSVCNLSTTVHLSEHQLQLAEAMAIIIASVITGIACIANDNLQDLKVGYILGATPWKQQVMLLVGVVVASLVIPPVMQLLFNVYGIAQVLPHAAMNPATTLPAPPAAMMAALTQAVFHHDLPWQMLASGAGIIITLLLCNVVLARTLQCRLSILGVAIGMYLPLASSMPLFIGGSIAWLTKRRRLSQSADNLAPPAPRDILLACGLVAGAALMDVLLAIPFSIMHSPDALTLVGASWTTIANILGISVWLALALWFWVVS